MRREEVLLILAAHRDDLSRHKVKHLSVFGSIARDEANADSDVDILVDFESPVGMFALLRLHQYLESLLGKRVDLVTEDALRRQMREQILKEAVPAA